jgi:hypothetical protein
MAGQVTILHAPPIVLALFLVRALRLLPPFWNLSYAASPNKAIPVSSARFHRILVSHEHFARGDRVTWKKSRKISGERILTLYRTK